ncbi:hypothetical protein Tco_1006084 [Tanacetum coccineum]|uniref:Uncharacterized protein n=1 Tax=Tanacetum coccineum TaxID=301880 RepID=A0ABQ5FH36_9ASTR
MLRRQHKVDDQHHDMPLIYYMEGHKLHFGHREFSLITGFRFGTVSFDLHSSGELKFRNRVFPNKICFSITNLDIIGVIEDEEIFGKLSDDDAIRLCLLLALENLKERHGDEHYYELFKDRNYFPTYTLSGFVFAFQRHLKDVKVGGLNDQIILSFLQRSTSDLRPTIAEYQSSWWIDNNLYFQEFVPRAPPIKEHHGLFETYLSKLEKARKRRKTSFMVSSIGGTTDNSVRKKWLNDLVIMELNFRLFKLETIIQVLSHERSDRQAKLKFTNEFSSMTSDLCDSLNSMFADLIEPSDPDEDISQLAPAKRIQLCSSSEKIQLKVRYFASIKSMDTVWLSDDIERESCMDFQLVRDTYVSCQHLMVRCEERHEQILELQNLVGSTVVAECVRLLQKFQQDDLESSRGMMRLICETQLKVLKKLSFIALLRRQ